MGIEAGDVGFPGHPEGPTRCGCLRPEPERRQQYKDDDPEPYPDAPTVSCHVYHLRWLSRPQETPLCLPRVWLRPGNTKHRHVTDVLPSLGFQKGALPLCVLKICIVSP